MRVRVGVRVRVTVGIYRVQPFSLTMYTGFSPATFSVGVRVRGRVRFRVMREDSVTVGANGQSQG